jgi:hypothetical protein
MRGQELISESTTLEEFNRRLETFRRELYGRSYDDTKNNMFYIAWTDGVAFGRDLTLRLCQPQK